jgi:hypothetical protein
MTEATAGGGTAKAAVADQSAGRAALAAEELMRAVAREEDAKDHNRTRDLPRLAEGVTAARGGLAKALAELAAKAAASEDGMSENIGRPTLTIGNGVVIPTGSTVYDAREEGCPGRVLVGKVPDWASVRRLRWRLKGCDDEASPADLFATRGEAIQARIDRLAVAKRKAWDEMQRIEKEIQKLGNDPDRMAAVAQAMSAKQAGAAEARTA